MIVEIQLLHLMEIMEEKDLKEKMDYSILLMMRFD